MCDNMRRRTLLKRGIAAGTTAGMAGLAGCSQFFGGGDGSGGGSLGNLRINCPTPEGTAIANYGDELATLVDEKSDGDITMDIFYSGELGSPIETFEGIKEGSIGGYITGWSVASNFYEPFAAFTLPFGFESYEANLEKMQYNRPDAVQDRVEEAAEQENLRAVEGGAAMLGSREPLATSELLGPDDYSGKAIRSPQSKIFQTVLGPDGLGANPTQIPPGEIGQAISTGRVNIIEIPLEFAFAAGYHEQLNYQHNAHHLYNDSPLWLNEEQWQSVDETEREIVRESVEEASKDYQLENIISREEQIVEDIQEMGVNYVTDDRIDHQTLANNVISAMDSAFSSHEGIRSEILPDGGPWGV